MTVIYLNLSRFKYLLLEPTSLNGMVMVKIDWHLFIPELVEGNHVQEIPLLGWGSKNPVPANYFTSIGPRRDKLDYHSF